jgi:hypothetical protein
VFDRKETAVTREYLGITDEEVADALFDGGYLIFGMRVKMRVH